MPCWQFLSLFLTINVSMHGFEISNTPQIDSASGIRNPVNWHIERVYSLPTITWVQWFLSGAIFAYSFEINWKQVFQKASHSLNREKRWVYAAYPRLTLRCFNVFTVYSSNTSENPYLGVTCHVGCDCGISLVQSGIVNFHNMKPTSITIILLFKYSIATRLCYRNLLLYP